MEKRGQGLTVGRRTVLAGIAGTAATGFLATSAGAATRSVDMERLVVASQIDQENSTPLDQRTRNSVRMVQAALSAKGTGIWDLATNGAYFNYQRGYLTEEYRTGRPDPKTLRALAKDNGFVVARVPVIGTENDSYGGFQVNTRTKKMLTKAAELVGVDGFKLVRGSYDRRDNSPEQTNSLGGTADLSLEGIGEFGTVRALRQVGFAAWLRENSIHAVAIGDYHLSDKAAEQVASYYRGGDGLGGEDNTEEEFLVPFTWWEQSQRA